MTLTNDPNGGRMDAIPFDVMEAANAAWKLSVGTFDPVGPIARAILAERERCAGIADAYANENITMAGDTILMDPILNRRPGDGAVTADDMYRSDNLMIGGTIHSSMYHAAANIAAAIRKGSTP